MVFQKLLLLILLVFVHVGCNHTFLGTNVGRPMVYHHSAEFGSKFVSKRIENIHFIMPSVATLSGQVIQGILAYDRTNTEASANVTKGGVGFNFVNIRLKSARGQKLNYDIYIYA